MCTIAQCTIVENIVKQVVGIELVSDGVALGENVSPLTKNFTDQLELFQGSVSLCVVISCDCSVDGHPKVPVIEGKICLRQGRQTLV